MKKALRIIAGLFAIAMSIVEALFPILESKIPTSVISVLRPINAFMFMFMIITNLASSPDKAKNVEKKYSKAQAGIVFICALFVMYCESLSFARTFPILATWQAVVMWWAIIGMLVCGKQKFFPTKHA